MDKPTRQVIFTIDADLHMRLRVAAAKRATTLAAMLRPILEEAAQALEAGRKEHDPTSV